MLQVPGLAPQPAVMQADELRPWVLTLQRSVADLRGTMADLGAKHWQLEVRCFDGRSSPVYSDTASLRSCTIDAMRMVPSVGSRSVC